MTNEETKTYDEIIRLILTQNASSKKIVEELKFMDKLKSLRYSFDISLQLEKQSWIIDQLAKKMKEA